jgi:flagellar biosynthetic protein FlhB
MAKPEQTEKATPKRREEARKRGQVPKSPELAGAGIFLAAVFVLHGFIVPGLTSVTAMMRTVFGSVSALEPPTIHSVWTIFAGSFMAIGAVLVVLFACTIGIALLANVLQFGFLFTLKPITPDLSKVNPLSGFKRLFSKQVVVNLAKQIMKLGAVLLILWTTINAHVAIFAQVGQSTPTAMIFATSDVVYEIAWKFGALLLVVAFADYAFQRYQTEESLKMSKQEVRDEYRQAEGNPEAKGAFKRKQREFARRRMMSAVPRATVVVTNPTHFAVALEWSDDGMAAPIVVAKGADLIAKRIREIAREHAVPIMENPPLARTLYDTVEIDQAIPPNLYAAVAQVIAFVFKLKRRTIA